MESRVPEPRDVAIFNWANVLSATRLLLAPLCAWLISRDHAALGLVTFGLAIATDLADGPLARRRGEVTRFGALLDHGSDALFVTFGLAAYAISGPVPAILPLLVALAFAQYTLDSRALSGEPLRASALGRWNGIAYFVLLGTPLVRDALVLGWPSDAIVSALGWLLVLTTIGSMLDRLIAYGRTRS
jgi:phosphatidylglycerophosphate synthase